MKDSIQQNDKAFKHLEYSIKAFARAAIYASTAIKELDKHFKQIEIIKKERRRMKRRLFWMSVKNLPTTIKNKFKR